MTGLREALVACCTVLALAGCSGSNGDAADAPEPSPTESSSSATPSEDEPALESRPAPEPGLCYRLTLEDAARPTNDSSPVECTGRHTTRTIYVGELSTVVEGHSLGVDSDRVQRQLASECPKQLAAYVGGSEETRALSRFEAIWFSPTLEEHDAGADWFRCDVVAVAGPDQLLELPSNDRLRDILDRPGNLETYGLCGTAQPGAQGFERVACALPHSWVAISTIPISGGDTYPGVATVRQAGDESCSDEVRSRNDQLLEYSYGWEWPTADQWGAGQRYGYCWAPDDLA